MTKLLPEVLLFLVVHLSKHCDETIDDSDEFAALFLRVDIGVIMKPLCNRFNIEVATQVDILLVISDSD